MSTEIWVMYVGTLLLFFSTPGPSHLLMLSVSLSNGFHRSLATAAGDLTANAMQITLVGLGLAALVTSSRYGFTVLKWAGVAYLFWVGLRTIVASFHGRAGGQALRPASLRSLWLRGFITSAANPKAVVFFAALFPQFLNTDAALPPQILILGLTYIVIDGLFLVSYGKGASWIGERISRHGKVWLDRASGGSLIVAALLLGLRSGTLS